MLICSKTNYYMLNVKGHVSFQVDVVDVNSFNCDLPKASNRRRATVSSRSHISEILNCDMQQMQYYRTCFLVNF
jgi:hypothetical protein